MFIRDVTYRDMTLAVLLAGCSSSLASTDGGSPAAQPLAAPLPVAPRSLGVVTTSRPLFRWHLPPGTDGAHVEVCRDRDCTVSVAAWDAVGELTRATTPITPGAWFWRLTGRLGDRTVTAHSATWEFVVPYRDTPTDGTRGTVVDVNGDGLADVLTLAAAVGVAHGNVVAVVTGRRGSPGDGPRAPDATVTLTLGPNGRTRLVLLGDPNGDGSADVGALALASSEDFNHGQVLLGGYGGLVALPTDLDAMDMACAGDLDGDGYGDLVGNNSLGPFLALGHRTFDPSEPNTFFGASYLSGGMGVGYIAGRPGDFNGDGVSDIALVPRPSDVVNIHPGHIDGTLPDPAPGTVLRHVRGAAGFDSVLCAAADVDGDGHEDLVIAPPSAAARQALVFLGGPAGLDTSPNYMVSVPPRAGGDPGAEAVVFVTGAGDVNGDGYADVAMLLSMDGAPDRVVVLGGGPMGLSSVPLLDAVASAMGAGIVADVAGVGDMDGDALDDLAVYLHPATGSDQLWIAHGGAALTLRHTVTYPGNGTVGPTSVFAHGQ